MKATLVSILFFCLFTGISAQDSAAVLVSFQSLGIAGFKAQPVSNNVQLNWTVNANEEVRSFEVERKDNEGTFKKVGGRLPKVSAGSADYEFVDALPPQNVLYGYRVRVVGKDGSVLFSPVQSIKIGGSLFQGRIRQNPVKTTLEAEVMVKENGSLTTTIYTAYGQKQKSETTLVSTGAHIISLPVQHLMPGVHRLVLEMGSERKVLSFVKE